MPFGALLRSLFLESDQLAKAKNELQLGRSIVTGTRRGPRPALPYPDRIVDVNPAFRSALFDGLSRYVQEETSRRASTYLRRKPRQRASPVPIVDFSPIFRKDDECKPLTGSSLSLRDEFYRGEFLSDPLERLRAADASHHLLEFYDPSITKEPWHCGYAEIYREHEDSDRRFDDFHHRDDDLHRPHDE